MIRPSFVLGGRSMRVPFNDQDLSKYFEESVQVSNEHPVLLDRYLHNCLEIDMDVVSDGTETIIADVLEHVERAGIHSGDSSCCLPPPSLPVVTMERIKGIGRKLAKELKVCGLLNVQLAVTARQEIYLLEANPRASRTVPFVSKATGTPWAKIASLLMAGKTFKELKVTEPKLTDYYSVKACVFPFSKFPGVDTILGPEMKSTGEVMGIYNEFSGAFAKSQIACGTKLPRTGTVFFSIAESDKPEIEPIVKLLVECNFKIVATAGTAAYLQKLGYPAKAINKVRDGSPHIVDALSNGEIDLVINTPEGSATLLDSRSIRMVANQRKVPTYTTIAAALACVEAIRDLRDQPVMRVKPIQEYYSQTL